LTIEGSLLDLTSFVNTLFMALATGMLQRGLRGAVGDLIFRNYNGKTVVSVRPVYKNETKTEARRQARSRFRDATFYASNAMDDVKLKAYYKQKARQLKLPNAYTAAITDYLRKAKVVVARRSAFAAKKGDVLLITMTKPVFSIKNVRAALYNDKGEMLTEQMLTEMDTEKSFELKFTDDFPDFTSIKFITDEPGDNEYLTNASAFLII
jgi:hypothetical protein